MGQKSSSLTAVKKAKQFGIPLLDSAKNTDPQQLVPAVLRASFAYINERALHTDGLYRIKGDAQHIEALRNLFENGESKIFENTNRSPSPHDITVKDAKLPLSLEKCQQILNQLTPCTKETLKLLIDHIILVSEEGKTNHSTKEMILGNIFPSDRSSIVVSAFIDLFEELYDASEESSGTDTLSEEMKNDDKMQALHQNPTPFRDSNRGRKPSEGRKTSSDSPLNMVRRRITGEFDLGVIGSLQGGETPGFSDVDEETGNFVFSSNSDPTNDFGTSLDAYPDQFLSEHALNKMKFSGFVDKSVETDIGTSPETTPRNAGGEHTGLTPRGYLDDRSPRFYTQDDKDVQKDGHRLTSPQMKVLLPQGLKKDGENSENVVKRRPLSGDTMDHREMLFPTIKVVDDEDKGFQHKIHSPRIPRNLKEMTRHRHSKEKKVFGSENDAEIEERLLFQDKLLSLAERIQNAKAKDLSPTPIQRQESLGLPKTSKLHRNESNPELTPLSKRSSDYEKYLKDDSILEGRGSPLSPTIHLFTKPKHREGEPQQLILEPVKIPLLNLNVEKPTEKNPFNQAPEKFTPAPSLTISNPEVFENKYGELAKKNDKNDAIEQRGVPIVKLNIPQAKEYKIENVNTTSPTQKSGLTIKLNVPTSGPVKRDVEPTLKFNIPTLNVAKKEK